MSSSGLYVASSVSMGYVYTKKAGWIDMVHFLFYAGKAYKYKVKGDEFPAGKSLENGLFQEFIDLFMAPHSAFSYEDLVSDKFGAIFGAEYFDASSELSFGEQLCTFMKTVLEATSPDNAPNIKDLPDSDGCVSEPSFRLFNTTNPLFTTSILENE